MLKLLKSNKDIILFMFFTGLFFGAFVSIVPAWTCRHDPGFFEVLKISFPVGIGCFSITMGVTFVYLFSDQKSKNKIIKKFDLKERIYKEVEAFNLLDEPTNYKNLFEAVKILNIHNSPIVTSISMENNIINISFDNTSKNIDVLVKLIYKLNGKFYLYLDEKQKIYWCIMNQEEKVIFKKHAACAMYYEEILNGFNLI